jgi:hypothetical protein
MVTRKPPFANGGFGCAPWKGGVFQWVKTHPAIAPAGSYRGNCGGDETVEAFGMRRSPRIQGHRLTRSRSSGYGGCTSKTVAHSFPEFLDSVKTPIISICLPRHSSAFGTAKVKC